MRRVSICVRPVDAASWSRPVCEERVVPYVPRVPAVAACSSCNSALSDGDHEAGCGIEEDGLGGVVAGILPPVRDPEEESRNEKSFLIVVIDNETQNEKSSQESGTEDKHRRVSEVRQVQVASPPLQQLHAAQPLQRGN